MPVVKTFHSLRPHITLLAALSLAVAALGLCDCAGKPSAAQAAAPPSVEAVRVAASGGQALIHATGALRWQRESILSFRIPGVMTRLFVDEGDAVQQGKVVATLDPTAVDARLRQAQADLDRAKRDLARFEPLVAKGAVPRQDLDNQKTALDQAQAAYASAAFDARWASLRSPMRGVVLSRSAQTGEVLQAGQPVVSVADTASPLLLRTPVADRDALRLRLGDPAKVRLEALQGVVLAGRVSRIGQSAGAQSGVVTVDISVPAAAGLRSGMIGAADIAPSAAPAAGGAYVRAPAEAILEANGSRAFILTLDTAHHIARRRAVTFGGFDGDDALIGGLASDATVITAGAGFVADGQTVRVIDPARFAGAAPSRS